MKTSLKTILGLLLLVTGYTFLSTASATCTLTVDNYQCNEDESCSLAGGCLCFGNSIAFNDICNGATISVDNSGVPATAISGSLVTFNFTVTNYTGTKYFVLHLPWTINYGIQYINASIVPNNAGNLTLGLENDPRFSVLAGETKNFVITGQVVAPYRTIPSLLATGNVYKDPLFQQLSVQALSSLINPTSYIVITKTATGAMPKFSGDALTYEVTLQNIGSLGEVDLSFLEFFPMAYLTTPVVLFDGVIQSPGAFISPNIFVRSGAYLVLNPGQIINVVIASTLQDNFAPTSFLNMAGFTTGGSLTPQAQNTASATGFIQPYLDIFASSITTGSVDPQMSGDAFAFTIDYAQTGNISATGLTMIVTVNGTALSGTSYPIPNLSVGGTGTFTFTGMLNANYPAGTLICANAFVASPTETETTGNNQISGCYTVAPVADIQITKLLRSGSVGPQGALFSDRETLQVGSNLIYNIFVTNTGTQTASGIVVTDTLPSQVSIVATTPTAQIIGNTAKRTIDLAPGQSQSFSITVTLNTYSTGGLTITNTATASFTGKDANLVNNTSTLVSQLPGLGDLYVTKTLLPFSGFTVNTPVTYVITYGNAGGRTISGVYLIDTFPTTHLQAIGQTARAIGTLTPGQQGQIVVTGTMLHFMTGGTSFANTVLIGASSTGFTITTTPGIRGIPMISAQNLPYGISEISTANNTSTVTGTIPSIDGTYLDLTANNLTRPQLDNPPYGTSPNVMIQANSGDVIRFTLSYGNNGNTPANNASLSLAGLAGISSIQNSNVSLGTLAPGTSATRIMTGIVGPKNFITFAPTATLAYNTNQFKTDSLTVNEPLACGDGLVTRTEECDTNGPVGNISAGQECENQQGSCVLVTKFIINNACISFDYNNPVTGYGTGASCSSIALPVTQASCSSLAVNGSALTCNGANTSNATRISINCGNGTILSGFGSSIAGNCNYTPGFNGAATCLVGSETAVASGCSQAISIGGTACNVRTLDGDMIIVDEDGNGTMPVVCEAPDGTPLSNPTVNCGADGDYDSGVCNYSDVDDIPDTRTISCSAPGGVSCSKSLIVDEGFLADCGNGIREGYEQCDGTPGCSQYCESEALYPPACFNINNANISVQEKEYLPFWRRLDQKKLTESCSLDSAEGKVVRNSLQCTFKLYNGTHKQSENDPAKTITKPCDENTRGSSNLFNYFSSISASAFGRYAIPMESSFVDETYGEYKLVLDSVSYKYCARDADDDLVKEQGEQVNRICEVNFTVTRPYLAQKSAFGLTPKSTDIDLEGFMDIQGNDIVRATDLDKIMTVDANSYDGGTKVKTMMKDFISKYEKLAIKIDKSKLSSLEGLNAVDSIKKVPNQDIYIFQGNGGEITLKGSFERPFTIVAKGINVRVKGDLATNGMLLVQGGKIIFDESDDKRCAKTQEVKGIFVTDKGFTSDQLANTLTTRPRCNYGGLFVKGVLIGDGIDSLVKARRSQLNSWFYLTSSNENSQQAQRRNKIFNGAAVLIEYSPSLRSSLPPGADEFTTALEVYKK